MNSGKTGFFILLSAVVAWSFGGAIARFISVHDIWVVVFWRSAWAALSVLVFLLLRVGWRATKHSFRAMGMPGLAVALCSATGSTSFVVALSYTTVANILLIQAGVPLIAALIGWLLFRERVAGETWVAISAVILGIAVMVSDSLGVKFSLVGNALALLLAIVYSLAIVLIRRYSNVRMVPAFCLGMIIAACIASLIAGHLSVTRSDFALLFAFGALSFGLGLALFATGAPLLPAAVTALIGTLESVLGPLWVWLIHNELPSMRTIVGGSIVVCALTVHLYWQHSQRRRRIAATPT
jgi:drug/metabolite transporter (DMT)-like permease